MVEETVIVSKKISVPKQFGLIESEWNEAEKTDGKAYCRTCAHADFVSGKFGPKSKYETMQLLKGKTHVIEETNSKNVNYGKKIGEELNFVCTQGQHEKSIFLGVGKSFGKVVVSA